MVKTDGKGNVLTLVDTYPYPVVKGYPTYKTDYSMFGMSHDEQKGLVSATGVDKSENDLRSPKMLKQGKKQKLKRDSEGNIIKRPPLSRSTSVGELDGVLFTGPNYKELEQRILDNYKKGIRLSKVYDNTSGYGSSAWTTTNAEFGSCFNPEQLKNKRHGLPAFANARYLPNHPHWKDRPYNAEQIANRTIPTPKSTYMDLGSFYLENNKLPVEHQYTAVTTGKR